MAEKIFFQDMLEAKIEDIDCYLMPLDQIEKMDLNGKKKEARDTLGTLMILFDERFHVHREKLKITPGSLGLNGILEFPREQA
jgi:hypothetical protein